MIESLGSKQKIKILFHQLDITDENSVKNIAEYLDKTHNGFVNNAGFFSSLGSTVYSVTKAEDTIKIHYYGKKLVSKHLIPLIRDGGRIVNVCSKGGIMNTEILELNDDLSQITNFKGEKDLKLVILSLWQNTRLCLHSLVKFSY